jgi:hypothetical protein
MTCGARRYWLVCSRRWDDGCSKTGVVWEHLDDEAKYSVLGYANRAPRVLPV